MSFSFRFYLGLLMRRLPVMMALIMIGSVLGIVTALQTPPVYSTSARLLVEAPQIPEGMATSLVETSATEQLSIIEQRLLTRANLLDIANKFNVFENIEEMSPDDVFARMRTRTIIRRTGGRNEATLMTLTFSGRSGRVVANVVNEYVTLILEANSEFRMSRAEGTLTFFQQEVERLGSELDQQSARIVQFKNQNEGALPDDLEFRLGRQTLLQERVERLERDISAARLQRDEVVRIFDATGRIEGQSAAVALSPEQEQLNELRVQLEEMRSIYSDSNPRVVVLQNRVNQLESTIAATASEAGEPVTPEINPAESVLQVSLAEIDSRIDRAEEEIASAQAEMARLEQSITATASNAIALGALERDYANLQQRYNAAVNNLSEARMGERIEVTSQGQRITVIESANAPEIPSGPNRPMIAAAGIGGGTVLAAAFFVLLEMLNFTIRRPAEIEARFGIRPIAAIPYIESRNERMTRRSLLLLTLGIVVVGVPAGLWYVHTNVMPLELITAKIMSRLGM